MKASVQRLSIAVSMAGGVAVLAFCVTALRDDPSPRAIQEPAPRATSPGARDTEAPRAGDAALARHRLPPPRPTPPDPGATLLFDRACALMQEGQPDEAQRRALERLSAGEALGPEDQAALEVWDRRNAEALDLLRQATASPRAGFGSAEQVIEAAKRLHWKALLTLHRGDAGGALEVSAIGLRLGDALRSVAGDVPAHQAACRVDMIVAHGLQGALDPAAPTLEESVAGGRHRESLARALEGSARETLASGLPSGGPGTEELVALSVASGQIQELSIRPYAEIRDRLEEILKDAEAGPPLLRRTVPAWVDAVFQSARAEALRSMMVLALNLETYHLEHGRYPPSLEHLEGEMPLDPLTGRPFDYRQEAGRYLLQSRPPEPEGHLQWISTRGWK